VELNDVPFGVGDPGDSHAFDEVAHVEWAERDRRLVTDLGELRVEVVDEEGDVSNPTLGGAVALAGRGCLALGRKELERDAAVPDHDHLAGAGQVDAQ